MLKAPVSLQINITPLDLPFAALIVPHQLRFWQRHCQELLLIWDLNPGVRYLRQAVYQQRWDQHLAWVNPLNQALQQEFPHLRILELEATAALRQSLSKAYFLPGTDPMPEKDFRGGPFLAYFYGLWAASHPHVLHLDADILLGGEPSGWLEQALQLLSEQPEYLAISPWGGPPLLDTHGSPLHRQQQTTGFSSRHFLLDRRRLQGQLQLKCLELFQLQARATDPSLWVEPYADLPEHLITNWMQAHQALRLACLDVWTLHPSQRSQLFYQALPLLLNKLTAQGLPHFQRGDYELQDATLKALLRAKIDPD